MALHSARARVVPLPSAARGGEGEAASGWPARRAATRTCVAAAAATEEEEEADSSIGKDPRSFRHCTPAARACAPLTRSTDRSHHPRAALADGAWRQKTRVAAAAARGSPRRRRLPEPRWRTLPATGMPQRRAPRGRRAGPGPQTASATALAPSPEVWWRKPRSPRQPPRPLARAARPRRTGRRSALARTARVRARLSRGTVKGVMGLTGDALLSSPRQYRCAMS